MEVEGTTTNDQISKEPQLTEEPVKNPITNSETTPSGGFDCNICLDFAVDPVVTLCGHLYCWQCIYKWLQPETSSMRNCPVCKASLSINSLVPLYGRGHSTTKRAHQNSDIPARPHHLRPRANTGNEGEHVHRQRHHHHHQYHVHHHYPYSNSTGSDEFVSAPSSPLLGATSRGLSGMAIAVLPLMFRNQQEVGSVPLGNSSPYYFSGIGGGSLRMRRQEKEVERSLHQIWLFLSCFAILCLLLF